MSSPEQETIRIDVGADSSGTRLDRFLSDALPDRSRSTVTRWIQEGRVQLDGIAVLKPGTSIRAAARIEIQVPPPPEIQPQAESIEIPVVHEDDDLIVIDKPAGLVVHPGHGQPDGTLVNGLLGLGVALAPAGGTQRPGIVHRLDRETSGLLVVAKTDRAHRALSLDFAERRIRKSYRALVWGRPDPLEQTIDRSIGRSRSNPTKMAVMDTRGARRSARTHYRTLETMLGFAWLEIDLETGRTHQIRVHLQSIRHPVVGDDRYGGQPWRGVQNPLKRAAIRKLEGLALHAYRLEFTHPATGERCQFSAPIPDRLTSLLKLLRTDER